MTKLIKNKKTKNLEVFLVFLIVSGIGMFSSLHFFGFEYGNPKMTYVLIWMEAVLTFYLISVVKKNFSWEEVGFKKLDKKALIWFFPLALIIAFGLIKFIFDLSEVNFNGEIFFTFLTLLATTILVGFNEELAFRGIILHSFIRRRKILKGIILSAFGFSLIHSVNFFAGMSISEIAGQLFFTFILGISFAILAWKLKNIWPLIIIHFLWDFLIFGNTLISTTPSSVLPLINFYEWILIILTIIFALIFRGKNEKKNF